MPIDDEETRALLSDSAADLKPSPDTVAKLVKRIRVLILTLLPVEVEPEALTEVASRVITPEVIHSFTAAAGDFVEALPYCLLRARKEFMWDANESPADYDENYGRAIACEVLARRIVHQAPPDRIGVMMSKRFQSVDWDGDESDLVSAMETAIDTHSTIFLSSNEAQDVINGVWNGDLVTVRKGHNHMVYVPYHNSNSGNFWAHLDPSRMSVPRYQNLFRIIIWLCFLGTYSQAVREPLDRVNPEHTRLDPSEVALYTLTLAFSMEDFHKLYKLLKIVTIRSFTFWLIVSIVTDVLLMTAFGLRLYGLFGHNEFFRLRAFQVLSFVAPLIWMKLITVFDGYKWVGAMQICIARMFRESGIFFALLSILGAGFAQGLYALDAADEEANSPMQTVHLLIQALLQAPTYDHFQQSAPGLFLYYAWNVATAVILLNVLVALFSSAYEDVVEDAEAEYLAYFAAKTVEMVRAPDSYVYPAPTNVLEAFCVAPFELVLSRENYAKLNRAVMRVVFFLPLALIALYESVFRAPRNKGWVRRWFHSSSGVEAEDTPAARDPDTAEAEGGLVISRVRFEELARGFPDVAVSQERAIVREVREVRALLEEVLRRMDKVEEGKKMRKKGKKKSGSSSSSSSSD